jgi:hypothetical protein
VIRSFALALAIVWDLIRVLFRSRAAVVAENLFLRRQLALYLERKTRRLRPTPATKFALAMLSPILSLGERSGDCQAGHVGPLAPSRIPSLLALEVSVRWPSSAAQESARTYHGDRTSESELGRRTNRRRIVAQTGSCSSIRSPWAST